MKDTKTILITGGAGAIGSNQCRRYVEEGHKVICLDNLQKTQTTSNVDDLLDKKNFRFIEHDIVNPIEFDEDIDWVINMACPVSCIDLQVDPIHTVRSTVDGVINMLEVARKHNAIFMQASSADIYGEKTEHDMTEEDWGSVNVLTPRACYEEGKRMGETICMDYHRMYGVQIKIARIFNTSGPGTHISDGRVISNFVFAALAERDLHIYGDGTATRSFLYIDDLVEGLDRFMRTEEKITGPINIGNNEEVTMLHLAETILKIIGSKSQIVYEERDDAPLHRRPDIRRAKEILNWEPTTPFEENIRKTIEHYKKIGLPESKVLVFSTTYDPDMGPAERALAELIESMPQTEFHIITTKFRKGLESTVRRGNVTIYRVGLGNFADKYLLPVLGSKKALALHKEFKYRFVWSVMASYGSIPALLLKKLNKRMSVLLLRDKSEKQKKGTKHIVKGIIEERADIVYGDNETDTVSDTKFISHVREDYAELLAKQEGKLVRPR